MTDKQNTSDQLRWTAWHISVSINYANASPSHPCKTWTTH